MGNGSSLKIADMGLAKHVLNTEQSFTFNKESAPFGGKLFYSNVTINIF